jgi:hypothetical protein
VNPFLCLFGGGFLGIESYNGKRSALFHLFRLHNSIGFDDGFKRHLNALYKGFYRTLRQGGRSHARRRQVRVAGANSGGNQLQNDGGAAGLVIGEENDDLYTGWNADEAKQPMSVDLLKAILGWLLDWGTMDGVFARCYLLLTWNLCCRVENTALIKMSDISWSSAFDAFSVRFAHSETDQLGENAKHERHIYANPVDPLVCPLLTLASYFTCCFNADTVPDHSFLFPGPCQQGRFSKILLNILQRNVETVRRLGYEVKDIGTHSIRKGASTYLTSLVGGPPAAAILVRGGWSMGNVKDRYFKYADMGDQYVGRCLTMTPIMQESLACSPPFFRSTDSAAEEWISSNCKSQFGALYDVVGFGRLIWMCLASMVYHRQWIESRCRGHHVIRDCSHIYRTNETLEWMAKDANFVVVTSPWNDKEHVFTGVPPHCALMQQLMVIRDSQHNILDSFVDNVVAGLNRAGVTGEALTTERIREMMNEFREDIRQSLRLSNMRNVGTETVADVIEETDGEPYVEDDRIVYRVHFHSGGIFRVPLDWRFPRCGIRDLWRQWWIGDTTRGIPPLRKIQTKDVNFLDKLPLERTETHGRRGQYANKRRPARKTLNDLMYLMNHMTQLVEQNNAMAQVISEHTVSNMFAIVEPTLSEKERDVQKNWATVYKLVRARVRAERNLLNRDNNTDGG